MTIHRNIEAQFRKGGTSPRHARGWWCLCLVLVAAAPVFAQTAGSTLKDLKTRLKVAQDTLAGQQAFIEQLQRRIEELEKVAEASPDAAAPTNGLALSTANGETHSGPSMSWKDGRTTLIFPAAQIVFSNRFQYRWTHDTFGDPAREATGAFEVARFKTQITGWAAAGDLTFRLQVDWAKSGSAAGVLDDAWVQYDFTRGRKWFTLRAGQGKTPFGRQSLASTASDMFTERSFVSTEFCTIRDVGLTATGRFGPCTVKDLIEYNVGVYNGGGRSVTTNPDGKYQTDYRLMISPWGSAGYDESIPNGAPAPRLSLAMDYEHNDRRLRDPETHGYVSGTEHWTTGYDLMFRYRWLTVYGEYFDRTARDVKNVSVDSSGLNLQVGILLIPGRLELVVGRWKYDPDRGKLGDTQTQTGIGLNWYFNGLANKLQADYRRIENDASKCANFELRVQYQLMF